MSQGFFILVIYQILDPELDQTMEIGFHDVFFTFLNPKRYTYLPIAAKT